MRRRTIIIWVSVCLSVMIICLVLGAHYRQEYIGLGGVIFCFVWLTVLGIINKVKTLHYVNHELKELAGEDPECPENVGELVQMSFGFTKDAKKKLKVAPTRDKLKVIALFVSLGLLLLTMAAGVLLARLGTLGDGTISKLAITGFILMGIGGGGFMLEIILLIVISSIKNR